MANINKIRLSGTTYNIEDENASKTVELTQAQYDALETKEPNTYYVITDATAADITNYYDKTETDDLLNAKADTATTYTKTETDTALATKADTATTYTKTEVDTALATKQATLVSGTNIKTINNESILGEGNITIQGGGGATYSAGTNISIDTANTINCTLPITTGTGGNSLSIGNNGYGVSQVSGNYAVSVNGGGYHPNTVRGNNSFAANMDNQAIGEGSFANGQICIANGKFSHAEGAECTANTYGSHAEGCHVITNNKYEHSQGKYNVSNSGSTESGQTLFSVGNGTSTSARHNAFEIRQNGDIYFPDTDNTTYANYYQKPMVRLQDMYGALGGLKLVKLTQAQYDALSTKDASTIYFING